MVKIQEAENQILTGYEVYPERPSASDLLVEAVARQEQRLGRTPERVAADAGFYSAANEKKLEEMGCEARGGAEPEHEERGAAAETEATMVPESAVLAYRVRRADQRAEATTRVGSQSLSGAGRHPAAGRIGCDRRQPDQYGAADGDATGGSGKKRARASAKTVSTQERNVTVPPNGGTPLVNPAPFNTGYFAPESSLVLRFLNTLTYNFA